MVNVVYADAMFENENARIAYTNMVEEMGHHLSTAPNGQKALELICQEPTETDILFLNLIMPVMKGWQVLMELKKRGSNLPVVICSEKSEEVIRRGIEFIGYDYVLGSCSAMTPEELSKYLQRTRSG